MKLKSKPVTISGSIDKITIARNAHGIPEITARTFDDIAFGMGWVHSHDRQLQTLLTRILLQGRAAEILAGEPALVEVDKYMRRMNFFPDPDAVIKKLEPAAKSALQAYADGFNFHLLNHRPVFEFRLLGHTPEPWEIKDTMILAKIMAYLGLADAQGTMEKFLVQMIKNDIDAKKLKELFPYLTEKIDYALMKKVTLSPPLVPEAVAWLEKIPRMRASNNWVVSGDRTESGKPICCSDPHLEVNRIPSIWQEIVLRSPNDTIMGASLPGTPALGIGRNGAFAWGPTYSFMDMIDYRIEHCRDGKYRRGKKWIPFSIREEIIHVKKGAPIKERIYENDLGILEGNPNDEGYYFVMCWSAARDCGAGDINGMLRVMQSKTVKEGMSNFRQLDALSFNWVMADTRGNIGYQMSGRLYNRPKGVSGLVPLPAWETKYDSRGFVKKSMLPSLYNPRDGIIVTANQDLNSLGKMNPINLPMAPYRADRITQLLKNRKKLTAADMKRIHFDLYSLQAARLMKIIRPLLPDTENGRTLRKWDCAYSADSAGATLFESVYQSLLKIVFGDHGMSREVVTFLMNETGLFNDYYGNFDTILMKQKSAWFNGRSRNYLFKKAIQEGLRITPAPYGETRQVVLSHLLFGGRLPRFLGFDYGPITLPGNRATVPQGQIFKSAGRITTFSPSYRMIADMATGEIQTTIAGGASDRRFSKWYLSDLQNWLRGVYKTLK